MKQFYFSIVIIKICRLFFLQRCLKRWYRGKNKGSILRGHQSFGSHYRPLEMKEKSSWGACLCLIWLLLSDAEQTAELGVMAREMCLQQPSRQPPARAGQLVVAEDMARTGQTRDQSCWHKASHFWQPLTLLRLWKGNSIWKQIWPKVFLINSSACGFWWIKKNTTQNKTISCPLRDYQVFLITFL